jgi:hypothetical protein
VLLEQAFAAVDGLDVLAPVEADDVGEQLDLLGQEVAVGAVDLAVEVAGVDEQHRVLAVGAGLALSRNHRVTGRVTV